MGIIIGGSVVCVLCEMKAFYFIFTENKFIELLYWSIWYQKSFSLTKHEMLIKDLIKLKNYTQFMFFLQEATCANRFLVQFQGLLCIGE